MTHPKEPWIDRYFPLLLITFGLIFIFPLALFKPYL